MAVASCPPKPSVPPPCVLVGPGVLSTLLLERLRDCGRCFELGVDCDSERSVPGCIVCPRVVESSIPMPTPTPTPTPIPVRNDAVLSAALDLGGRVGHGKGTRRWGGGGGEGGDGGGGGGGGARCGGPRLWAEAVGRGCGWKVKGAKNISKKEVH